MILPDGASLQRTDKVVNEVLQVQGENLRITAVTIGNPHCVSFMTKISRAMVEKLALLGLVPTGANI